MSAKVLLSDQMQLAMSNTPLAQPDMCGEPLLVPNLRERLADEVAGNRCCDEHQRIDA
jgi:hypothetical protein